MYYWAQIPCNDELLFEKIYLTIIWEYNKNILKAISFKTYLKTSWNAYKGFLGISNKENSQLHGHTYKLHAALKKH
jgi:hypothetical protein